MTMIMEKIMYPCLNVNFVDMLDIKQSIQHEGQKKHNSVEVHVLLSYNSKIKKNVCFNANNTTHDMALWAQNSRNVTSSIWWWSL